MAFDDVSRARERPRVRVGGEDFVVGVPGLDQPVGIFCGLHYVPRDHGVFLVSVSELRLAPLIERVSMVFFCLSVIVG